MDHSRLRHIDLTTDVAVAAMLMNRVGWDYQQIVNLEIVGLPVVPFPPLTSSAEKGRRADMAVRPAHRRVGRNVGKMTSQNMQRPAIQNVIADEIAGLMRTAVAVHRCFRRERLEHMRQTVDENLLPLLMHETFQPVGVCKFFANFPGC